MWLCSIKVACRELICRACCKVKADTNTFAHVVFILEINWGSVSQSPTRVRHTLSLQYETDSKQSSTWELARGNTSSVQAPILGKRILLGDKSDNHVLYRIASQIWQLLQHGMGS